MTVMEFFGCSFFAFGPPLAMVMITIAHDPVRIIILIAAAFFWLLSLLCSSLLWYIVIPLRDVYVFGVIFSIMFQESFRYLTYKIIRKAEVGLKKITDDGAILVDNKHILAYVSGLGFGIMSGMFSLVNVVADAIGPGTMGLKSGTELFFITSSATCLCFILLNTFWNILFFHALDTNNRVQLLFVIANHYIVSLLTLFNHYHVYYATIPTLYLILITTAFFTFKVCGGSTASIKNSLNRF